MTRMKSIVVVAAFGLTAVGHAASAQSFGSFSDFGALDDYNRGRNISVMQRERPEYAATGVRARSFLVYPKLESTLGFTDNVFATETNRESDQFVEFSPSVNLQSDWSRHSLSVDAGGDLRRYIKKSTENNTALHLRSTGRIDLVGSSYALIAATAEKRYEDRTSGGFPTAASAPVPFKTYSASGRGVYQEGRVRSSASIDLQKVDFSSVAQTGGGRLDLNSRDQTNATVALRGEYAPTPDTGVFGEVAYVNSDYRLGPSAGVPLRDSKEVRILGGADFDLGALVRGELGAGYIKRSYDAAAFGSIDGVAVRGQVEYFPSQLTTVTVNVARSIRDAVITNSGGYFSNTFGARIDHELLRNFLINATAGYEDDKYKGVDRHDKISNLGVGFQYFMNRGVGLGVSYAYAKRDSSGVTASGPRFDANRLRISLVLRR